MNEYDTRDWWKGKYRALKKNTSKNREKGGPD